MFPIQTNLSFFFFFFSFLSFFHPANYTGFASRRHTVTMIPLMPGRACCPRSSSSRLYARSDCYIIYKQNRRCKLHKLHNVKCGQLQVCTLRILPEQRLKLTRSRRYENGRRYHAFHEGEYILVKHQRLIISTNASGPDL